MGFALRVEKVTALPAAASRIANTLYMVKAADANYVELYVTENTGSPVPTRRLLTPADVDAKITAAVTASKDIQIVADITARNALAPTSTMYALVLNATGDATVASGAATYLYNPSNTTWVKVSEAESMDVALTWASLSGKPTSTVAAIDAAVTNSHTHANKATLDKFGEANSLPTYNGQPLRPYLDNDQW